MSMIGIKFLARECLLKPLHCGFDLKNAVSLVWCCLVFWFDDDSPAFVDVPGSGGAIFCPVKGLAFDAATLCSIFAKPPQNRDFCDVTGSSDVGSDDVLWQSLETEDGAMETEFFTAVSTSIL